MSCRKLWLIACLGLLWLPGCSTGTPSAWVEGVETSSKAVTMAQVPAAVKKTVLKEAGRNELMHLEEKVLDGKTVYEAAWMLDGKEIELMVAPDGKVLNTKIEEPDAEKGKESGKQAGKAEEWRSSFDVDKKNLASTGRNPYFILVPGHRIHLKGGGETVIISVLDETKVVDGVETRIVEEREFKNDKLAEVSKNYFAIDKTTNDVYYFGEDVDVYTDGKVVGHGGAWLSGEKGAKFGLIMPGKPKLGDKYYQEHAPKEAMDRAEIAKLDATLKTPMKAFKDVLYVRETSALEGGVSHKWYVAGIGMIGDDDLRLVKVETVKAEAP